MSFDTAPKGRDKRIALVLFGTMFSSAISQSFMFAIMPVLGRNLGISDFAVGLVASLPALTYVIAAPILGALVDRIGSLLLIRVGLLAGILSNLAFAWTISLASDGYFDTGSTLVILLLSRVVLNIAWGGMFPAAHAYMALSTSASQRIGGMALLAGASGIGAIVGPVIPAAVSGWGPIAPFYVVSILSGLSLLTTLLVTAEKPPLRSEPEQRGVRDLLNKTTAPFFITAFLLMLSLTTVQQLVGFQMQDTFNFESAESAVRTGQLLATAAIAMLAAQWAMAAGAGRDRAKSVLATGTALGCISMFLIITGIHTVSLTAFFCSFALFGACMGMLLPTNAGGLSLVLPQTAQGQAAGFLGSAQGSGRIAGPLSGTMFYSWSASAPYWLGAAAFVLIAYLGILRRPRIDTTKTS